MTNTIQLKEVKINENTLIELIKVKAGSFMMGGKEYDDEQPVHEVKIAYDFWIGKYPVTQAQYEAVMKKNPAYFIGKDRPVERISWDDTQIFIKELNKQTGENFRLPSEAEWEYAARGGGEYYKDNFKYSGSNNIDEVAWYGENSHKETKPVGLKLPNQLGIYDMSGNVWEWCEDDWHGNYENAPKDGSAWKDNPRSDRRVLRGGAWSYGSLYCRVADRTDDPPFNRNFSIGCRHVLF